MPENADYDISSLKIDPGPLGTEGERMLALAQEMGESITLINNTVADLVLGWVSPSAEEAHEFGNRWTRVMTQMFGQKDGAIGVLPAISGGVRGTAVGFSHVELELERAFVNFSNELAVPSGDGGNGPSDHSGSEFPITQDFPN
ncbi:WXG100 family type VII secretion target [Streptomyces sp. NPDC001822]|uniref:WXG100 family type VII secretion target n=1 Tax=Streptomyces sp. NPDC001822 TaxID=3364614 RepID=UPI00367973E9